MSGSAHGKVIVLGEHAVVHAEPALAVAITAGVTLEFEPSSGPGELLLTNVGVSARLGDGSRLGEALRRLVFALEAPDDGWRLFGPCDVPLGGGLGSSAAIAAAVVRALCHALGLDRGEAQLFDAVQASEGVFHGTPSGIDAAVALQGGVLRFTRKGGATPIEAEVPRLAVVTSGEPKDTKTAVERFTRELDRSGAQGQKRLRRIGELVDVGVMALRQGDLSSLGAAMNENQELLRAFGVSTSTLDHICQIAIDSGALGAKLTGAGCGGAAIVLCTPGDAGPVEALRRSGFEVMTS